MNEKSDQISCPTCEKIVFKRGLFGHLRFGHEKTPEEAHEIMSSLHEKTPEKVEKLIEAQDEIEAPEDVEVQEDIEEDPEEAGSENGGIGLLPIFFIIGIPVAIFLSKIPKFKEISDKLLAILGDLGSKKSSLRNFPPPGF